MRGWLIAILAVAALIILATWRIQVMVAGGKALLALLFLALVGWLLIPPARRR